MSSPEDKDIELVEQVSSPRDMKWLDDLLLFRWYSLRVLLMVTLATFTSLASNVFMIFGGATPNIIGCDGFKVDNCHGLQALQNLTGCQPLLDYQFISTQVEFNLICDEEATFVKNTISIQILGVLIGAANFRKISDRIGRQYSLLITSFGCAVSCSLAAFTDDFMVFTILRIFCGYFSGGLAVVQTVFKSENISKKHLIWILNMISWSTMLTIFPLVAYFSHDWRTLSIVIGCTSFLTFLSIFLLHESPRFYIQRMEFKNALRVLIAIRKIDRMYNDEFKEDVSEVLAWERWAIHESMNKPIKFDYLSLKWKGRTVILMTGIACTSAIVYSLMYNMEHLPGSLYWNCAYIGAARWTVNILITLLDCKFIWFGRKIASQLSMVLTAIALAGISGYIYIGESGMILTIGTVIAASMCSQLFILKYMMVNELYPSEIRLMTLSAVSNMSRIGSMFSPQIFFLAEYAEWLPYVLIFCLQIYDLVVFSIAIPETKSVHLLHQKLHGSKRRQSHIVADN